MSLIDSLLERLGLVRMKKYGVSISLDGQLVGDQLVAKQRQGLLTPPQVEHAAAPDNRAAPSLRRMPLGTLTPPTALASGSQSNEVILETGADDDEWEWRMAMARAKANSAPVQAPRPSAEEDAWEAALARAKADAKKPPPVPPSRAKRAVSRQTSSEPVSRLRQMPTVSSRTNPAPKALVKAAAYARAKPAPESREGVVVPARAEPARRPRAKRVLRPSTTPTVQLLVNKKKPTPATRDKWTAADTMVDLVSRK